MVNRTLNTAVVLATVVAAVLWVPPAANAATPTVAADGSGVYRTVRAAIDAVPVGTSWRRT